MTHFSTTFSSLLAIHGKRVGGVCGDMTHICLLHGTRKSSSGHHPFVASLKPMVTHISIDFATRLSTPEGKTLYILVDRFSKIADLIPLNKPHSAKEMTEIILSNIVNLHCYPRDEVSESLFHFGGGYYQFVLSLPPSIQWPVRVDKPRTGNMFEVSCIMELSLMVSSTVFGQNAINSFTSSSIGLL